MAEEKEVPFETKEMKKYFESIKKQVLKEYEIANEARKKGFDPEEKVDSPLAENMIERVEGIISVVAPQLVGSGADKRMFELEKEYGVLDWRVALVIAEEVAKEKFCKFKDKKEAMEVGIRTGFAYHTLGIVAAPLEGFIGIDIKNTKDGKEYFAIRFAGPIRGAGGTGASVCVLIADYVRKKMGYAKYDPDENEVNRFVTELYDYHERITNLQYLPTEDEIKFLASNMPIEVGGDPTEKIEVSNYKDLPRINTNKIRGGLCLVFAMIALKAPKLWKRLEKWGTDFYDEDWQFLDEFLKLQKKKKAGTKKKESKDEKPKLTPNKVFIADLVAGRPVLTPPMGVGGFRLRYGRCRTTGFSASAIHPATMHLMNDYIAVGTQLKVERPGKAASMTVCDYIEGPIVKLKNGNVLKLNTEEEAKEIKNDVEQILFLGDILFNYGDFSENGHMLVPSGYCPEWWQKELEKEIVNLFGSLDLEKATSLVNTTKEDLQRIIKDPIKQFPSLELTKQISQKFNLALHPEYTFYWKSIVKTDLLHLLDFLEKAKKEDGKIILGINPEYKLILEKIGVPHSVINNEFIVIEKINAEKLFLNLGITTDFEEQISKVTKTEKVEVLDILMKLTGLKIKDKSGTFIGARMGRPEKAKMRKLTGSPHSLFPVGEEGDRLRCFQSALQKGKITSNFAQFYCKSCKKDTVISVCESCGKKTFKRYFCKICGKNVKEKDCDHEKTRYKRMELDINHYFEACLKKLKTRVYPDLIKGVRGTPNKDHLSEHLIKGILRAKHDVYVNKDGSVRYDMTELPITHFKPNEIEMPVSKLKELGYEVDMNGKELVQDTQILELKPQDVILPDCPDAPDPTASEVLLKVSMFVDELLEKLYGLKPYFNAKTKQDLAGHLVLGLAPHISAAMAGRIIGFSKTAGCYAHPLWHAALRRDCDGDEASVSLLLDSLLNFSRQYLPDRIGSRTMDAPLVMTAKLIPSEVDDMVHGMDVVKEYPVEFYDAAMNYKMPWDVDIEQEGKRLGKWKQYEQIGFTHDTTSINQGILCSAYKTLPSMREKLDGQMQIAEKIKAVNTQDVARLVIEKHFIKDIKGNLRKFSMQQFRCVKCNGKFRRPPLLGRCTSCGGKIIFTISEGSVIKYLGPAVDLAKKYDLALYLQQTLNLVQRRVDEVFGREKERQEGLDKWFGDKSESAKQT